MLINELPDDCLVAIFDHINDLKDLINCFKVCTKWRDAIVERAIKVKYFIEHPNDPHDCVHGDEEDSEKFDGGDEEDAVSGNEIAEISDASRIKVEREVIVAFVRNQRFLRGIINFSDEQIEGYCGVLEMIAGNHIMAYEMRNGPSIKQLYFGTNTPEVDLSYFPNLERLHITNNKVPYSYYYGPVLENLKIVETGCSLHYATEINYAFQFMDSCPTLQSAHITINGRWITDETLKHGSLQDLVIDFLQNDDFEWNDLIRLLMKYPNLKHLALWNQLHITDEHIKQLVHILPNLVLLDARGCVIVTEEAASYVKSYYGRYGRPIRFYFDDNEDDIGLDWPKLSTKVEKISRGFDFIKQCFLKHFDDLPFFLVPIDD